ncbi:MAG: hypothetical protein OXP69_11190 [Spirochaetaceae bacterium]|nr:hypothetical protein [Spirochaetaceae bacterium]
MSVDLDEGDNTSFTLKAMPAPASTLTVTLSWSFTGDLFDPPVDTGVNPTPRPETVTIPTSGSSSLTVTVGDDDQKSTAGVMIALVSIHPGDGYDYDVPHKLYFYIEDND